MLCMCYGTAKEGITLTSADTVLFVERMDSCGRATKIESIVSVKNHNQYTQSISVAKTIDEKFDC